MTFPRDLATFHHVVLAGSIRKASNELNVAPSSISRKIIILEHQFGTALFERTPKGLVLTYAGHLVAEYAKSTVLDFERLRADLDDLRGVKRRLIHVAAVESAAVGRSAVAIERFRQNYKGVTFKFTVVPAPQVPQIVSRGECDIGLAFCCAPSPGIKILESISEPIVAVAPKEHPLSRNSCITIGELADYAVALPENSFRVRELFDQACYAADVEIEPSLTSNNFGSLKGFVTSGAGVAILPRGAVAHEEKQGEVVTVSIDVDSLSCTTIDIIVRKGRLPRIVGLFVEEMQRTLGHSAERTLT
ncbi:LysR family transcriptional regulator [Sphingosinicella rhizophila]|uniref:LysR family transcriptional regulator n=1 Tax=Sphingosinicella rhizophila TaxID=3050082 RepID=A0ABU3Q5J5_9SPHN|nr:LysR family transcriptional regulator [Sphingosinicella sp. GR2756]MDT9598679.1 LysR family transcriptional regulator [Sphingosinicella sp. GR2756]